MKLKKIKSLALILAIGTLTMAATCQKHEKKEHGGDEVKGKEHAGDAQLDKKQTPAIQKNYSAIDIKSTMKEYISKRTENGIFEINDPQNENKTLRLEFVKIHDPVRKIAGQGFFGCTDFKVAGDTSGKVYDLDFWLNPMTNKLEVYQERIHKHPILDGQQWVKKARYTFIDDQPVTL